MPQMHGSGRAAGWQIAGRAAGRALAVLVPALALAAEAAPQPAASLERVGTIAHEPIREASGLVASPTQQGIFWTLSDSLNPAAIYAIDRTGRCLGEFKVADTPNIDWEAIGADERGCLYIGDIGNNSLLGGLMSRQVYQVREPKVARPEGKAPPVRGEVEVERTYEYGFTGRPFDAEALFVRGGEIYIIEKVAGPTHLYRLQRRAEQGDYRLTRVCALPGVRTATDASLSADGRRLAVCSYGRVFVFGLEPGGPIEALERQEPTVVAFSVPAVEACSWDGDDLLLASERREVYRLRIPRREPERP